MLVTEGRSVDDLLELSTATALWPVRRLPGALRSRIKAPGASVSNALARRAARDADVVVATYDELVGFDLEDLAGKAVISRRSPTSAWLTWGRGAWTWCSTSCRNPSR